MITNIRLQNYKSFTNINFNLMKNKNEVRNLALIYGENGAGKSNLISAINNLRSLFDTILSVQELERFNLQFSDLKDDFRSQMILENLKRGYRTTETIIEDCKTIESEEPMVIEIEFNFNKKKGSYLIETNDKFIIREKLEYTINKNKGVYFDIDDKKHYINNSIILSEKYKAELESLVDQYWGKHTFMSIIKNERKQKNQEFLEKVFLGNFWDIFENLHSINCDLKEGNFGERKCLTRNRNILIDFERGLINKKNKNRIEKTEVFVNEIFTKLYSDIKKAYYIIEEREENLSYQLFIDKMIGGKIRRIPIEKESTGTLKILELIPTLLTAIDGGIVFIDEFDSGIHDLMITHILKNVFEYLDGQLIVTTHNSKLMEDEDLTEYLYFIDIDEKGDKQIKSILDYDMRTRNSNNPRTKYFNGVYGAVPFCSEIDFDYMNEKIKGE